jgi:hypothetical protein
MTDRHFVPVAFGYFQLELVCSHSADGEFKVCHVPIAGWEMRAGPDRPNMNYFAHSVTAVCSPYRDAVVAILEPDGVVRLTNGASFPSQAEWLVHAADEARAREEA